MEDIDRTNVVASSSGSASVGNTANGVEAMDLTSDNVDDTVGVPMDRIVMPSTLKAKRDYSSDLGFKQLKFTCATTSILFIMSKWFDELGTTTKAVLKFRTDLGGSSERVFNLLFNMKFREGYTVESAQEEYMKIFFTEPQVEVGVGIFHAVAHTLQLIFPSSLVSGLITTSVRINCYCKGCNSKFGIRRIRQFFDTSGVDSCLGNTQQTLARQPIQQMLFKTMDQVLKREKDSILLGRACRSCGCEPNYALNVLCTAPELLIINICALNNKKDLVGFTHNKMKHADSYIDQFVTMPDGDGCACYELYAVIDGNNSHFKVRMKDIEYDDLASGGRATHLREPKGGLFRWKRDATSFAASCLFYKKVEGTPQLMESFLVEKRKEGIQEGIVFFNTPYDFVAYKPNTCLLGTHDSLRNMLWSTVPPRFVNSSGTDCWFTSLMAVIVNLKPVMVKCFEAIQNQSESVAKYLVSIGAVLKINDNKDTCKRTRSICVGNSHPNDVFVDNFVVTVLFSHCYKAGEESSLPFDISYLQELFMAACGIAGWTLSDGFNSPISAFLALTEILPSVFFQSIFLHELVHYLVCSGNKCSPEHHGAYLGKTSILGCSVTKSSNQLDASVSFIDPVYQPGDKICQKCGTANLLSRRFKGVPPEVLVLCYSPQLLKSQENSSMTAAQALAVPQDNVLISKEFFMVDSTGTQHAYIPVSVIERPVAGKHAHFTVAHLSRVDKMQLKLDDHHEIEICREMENGRQSDKFWTFPASMVFCVRNPQHTTATGAATSSISSTTASASTGSPQRRGNAATDSPKRRGEGSTTAPTTTTTAPIVQNQQSTGTRGTITQKKVTATAPIVKTPQTAALAVHKPPSAADTLLCRSLHDKLEKQGRVSFSGDAATIFRTKDKNSYERADMSVFKKNASLWTEQI